MCCIGNGVDFVSDSINAIFAPQAQQSVVRIPITEDELMEDVEYFGMKFSLSPTDALPVVFRSGNITLAMGVILDDYGNYMYIKPIELLSICCISFVMYVYMYVCLCSNMLRKSLLTITYLIGYWKTDQIVTLGLFHFIGPPNSHTHTLPIHSAITRLG